MGLREEAEGETEGWRDGREGTENGAKTEGGGWKEGGGKEGGEGKTNYELYGCSFFPGNLRMRLGTYALELRQGNKQTYPYNIISSHLNPVSILCLS